MKVGLSTITSDKTLSHHLYWWLISFVFHLLSLFFDIPCLCPYTHCCFVYGGVVEFRYLEFSTILVFIINQVFPCILFYKAKLPKRCSVFSFYFWNFCIGRYRSWKSLYLNSGLDLHFFLNFKVQWVGLQYQFCSRPLKYRKFFPSPKFFILSFQLRKSSPTPNF